MICHFKIWPYWLLHKLRFFFVLNLSRFCEWFTHLSQIIYGVSILSHRRKFSKQKRLSTKWNYLDLYVYVKSSIIHRKVAGLRQKKRPWTYEASLKVGIVLTFIFKAVSVERSKVFVDDWRAVGYRLAGRWNAKPIKSHWKFKMKKVKKKKNI